MLKSSILKFCLLSTLAAYVVAAKSNDTCSDDDLKKNKNIRDKYNDTQIYSLCQRVNSWNKIATGPESRGEPAPLPKEQKDW